MKSLPFGLIYGKRRNDVSTAVQSRQRPVAYPLLVGLAAAALLCGVFFRTWGLGVKLYTNDEATTSVHVSGHTIADYLRAAAAGRITTAAAALRYQHIDPATSQRDVIASLAVEDPQHPPLFYVLERGWEALFGTSLAARRTLPAIFGILGIFAAYAFGCALVPSRRFGLVLAALVAVSPFHVVYSQQAREYSLWTLFVFAGSATLLRALRAERSQPALWVAFAALTAAALYTDVIYLYTLFAQAVYVLVAFRRQVRRKILPFAAAAVAGLVLFSPWLAVLVSHARVVTNNAYLGAPLPAAALALKWLFNAGVVFFDLDYVWHPSAVVVLPILALAAFGIVALSRREPAAGGYVLALGIITAAAFVLPDLFTHESRSTAARYLIPTWIALEAAVAFALWSFLRSAGGKMRGAGVAAFAAVLVCGVASVAVSATHEAWWGDGSVAPLGPMSRLVREAARPVTVIFRDDQPIWNFAPMELADEVPPQTRFELLTGERLPSAVTAQGTTFLLDPSPQLRKSLTTRGLQLRSVYRQQALADDLQSFRRATSLTRARNGVVDVPSSLWIVTDDLRGAHARDGARGFARHGAVREYVTSMVHAELQKQ